VPTFLCGFFEKHPRIRMGEKQTVEILINEEALLLAKFLRTESNYVVTKN